MAEEKREKPRGASLAEVSFEHLGVSFEGRIADLSEGGFFIDTLNPLPEETVITFRFHLPGAESETPLTGEGRVAWMHPFQGMGVSFTFLSDEDRERLSRYLKL